MTQVLGSFKNVNNPSTQKEVIELYAYIYSKIIIYMPIHIIELLMKYLIIFFKHK